MYHRVIISGNANRCPLKKTTKKHLKKYKKTSAWQN